MFTYMMISVVINITVKEFDKWIETILYCSCNSKIGCCSIVELKKGIVT